MTSSKRNGRSTRRSREHADDATKTQRPEEKAIKLPLRTKEKSGHHANTCSREKHAFKRECDCTRSNSQNGLRGRKCVRHVPHDYTPFHHLSLDVVDGLPDEDEVEFGADPENGQHDYIGDESTTILTPSYDSTTSTVADYLIESGEHAAYDNMVYPYSHTTHDLQHMGCWTETDEVVKEAYQPPDYTSAMNIGWRYATRNDGTSGTSL